MKTREQRKEIMRKMVERETQQVIDSMRLAVRLDLTSVIAITADSLAEEFAVEFPEDADAMLDQMRATLDAAADGAEKELEEELLGRAVAEEIRNIEASTAPAKIDPKSN